MGDIGHCHIISSSAVDRETNLLDCLYPEIQLWYAYKSLISFLNSLFLFERTNIIFICISGDEFEAIRPLIQEMYTHIYTGKNKNHLSIKMF